MAKLTPKTTKEHIIHIYDKIDRIENNHLFHIEKDIKKLNYVLWAVGFMIGSQFLNWVLRMFS
jgi:hypothetical protein